MLCLLFPLATDLKPLLPIEDPLKKRHARTSRLRVFACLFFLHLEIKQIRLAKRRRKKYVYLFSSNSSTGCDSIEQVQTVCTCVHQLALQMFVNSHRPRGAGAHLPLKGHSVGQYSSIFFTALQTSNSGFFLHLLV